LTARSDAQFQLFIGGLPCPSLNYARTCDTIYMMGIFQ
jgi:hypothetical protein